MKLKAIIGCTLVAVMLTVSVPALAAEKEGFGVSPPSVVLEVLGNGSAEATFKVHYFDGNVGIELEDIPLRVEPSVIHVEASDGPEEIVLTIYGNHSLSTQVFNGKIKFSVLNEAGGALAGVKVWATVTNTADGIVPPEEPVIKDMVVTVLEEPVVTEEPVVEEPAAVETTTVLEPVAEETITPAQNPWLIPLAAGGGCLILVLAILLRVAWKQGWVA